MFYTPKVFLICCRTVKKDNHKLERNRNRSPLQFWLLYSVNKKERKSTFFDFYFPPHIGFGLEDS
jgi:hypothetical protein